MSPSDRKLTSHRISETKVVVYDRSSRQLTVLPSPNDPPPRGPHEHCPACGHRIDRPFQNYDIFPEYFSLLQSVESGSPKPPVKTGISSAALSQGYFDRFFKSLRLLGRGSRASVYLVEHILDNVSIGKFAMKKVPVGNDREWLEKVLSEVHLLRQLSHDNLVKYNHVWLELSSPSSFGPEVPCAFILQEYCEGGTLEDYVFQRKTKPTRRLSSGNTGDKLKFGEEYDRSDDGRLSVYEIKQFMIDITEGTLYLHDKGIIHRDLKPSNCLLQYRHAHGLPTVLLSDFGESQLEGTMRHGTGSTGTLEYCAPELLRPLNGTLPLFSKKSDMFSIGMILHFLAFSDLPYSDAWQSHGDLEALKAEVASFAFNFGYSNTCMNRSDLGALIPLMRNLLGSPEVRPTANVLLTALKFVDVPLPVNQTVSEPLPKNKQDAILRVIKILSVCIIPTSPTILRILGSLAAAECVIDWPMHLFVGHWVILLGAKLYEQYTN